MPSFLLASESGVGVWPFVLLLPAGVVARPWNFAAQKKENRSDALALLAGRSAGPRHHGGGLQPDPGRDEPAPGELPVPGAAVPRGRLNYMFRATTLLIQFE